MQEQMFKPGNEEDNFRFDGPQPNNNLISYRNMILEMNHSATTDTGCSSLVATVFLAAVIVVVVVIVVGLLSTG